MRLQTRNAPALGEARKTKRIAVRVDDKRGITGGDRPQRRRFSAAISEPPFRLLGGFAFCLQSSLDHAGLWLPEERAATDCSLRPTFHVCSYGGSVSRLRVLHHSGKHGNRLRVLLQQRVRGFAERCNEARRSAGEREKPASVCSSWWSLSEPRLLRETKRTERMANQLVRAQRGT